MPIIQPLLIRNAEINGIAAQDLLIADGLIMAVGNQLPVPEQAKVIEANGGAVLPGLNDHHLHLASLAVAQASLDCRPAAVNSKEGLVAALQMHASKRPEQWLRGIGYCESIAGDIDAAWLDATQIEQPLRIQHRGGRLWVFNSAALAALEATEHDPLERVNGQLTGRLYEGDAWLQQRLAALGLGRFPDLSAISLQLASYGITGVTDTTPRNSVDTLPLFAAAQAKGELRQSLRMMGDASLDGVDSPTSDISIGEHKFHLLESALPDIDEVIRRIKNSHAVGRNVAFHCVTRTELVFALSALEAAGSRVGDRIEHASITPLECLPTLKSLGLRVVTQPALITERGDHYLAEVEQGEQAHLYRLRAFLDAGIPLAASSDAPYTQPNPWVGMQAAVNRRTVNGVVLSATEALSAEAALALYTSPLMHPGDQQAVPSPGMPGDVCLLSQSWHKAKQNLAAVKVAFTLRAGQIIWQQGESYSPCG